MALEKKNDKLSDQQYKEKHTTSLESERVQLVEVSDVEHMREKVQRAMVDSAREVCGSVM